MWASVDLCLIPLGVGISLSPYLAICKEIIEATGLDYEIGPNGTAIEGEWDQVFACVKACHEAVHENGTPRIYATVKVNTRIDRKQSFREKVASVEACISNRT
tara:strand:+ start:55 stop:363 length:309 start_codon:yes stop_codon:yes gene_type:complete